MGASEYREQAKCAKSPLGILDIHLQRCTKTPGSTCNGSGSCVRSYNTCDDLCNIDCTIKDNTHTTGKTDLTGDIYRHDITEPEVKGSKVQLLQGMPPAREIVITFKDSPSCDWTDDPFILTREHAGKRAPGTQLEKFNQRHILEGRRITYSSGFDCTSYPADFISRDYWMDKFTRSGECQYRLSAKDALGFFNLSDSKWPAQVKGSAATVLVENGFTRWKIDGIPEDTEVVCVKGEAIKLDHYNTNEFIVSERGMCGSVQNDEDISIGTEVTAAGYLPKGMSIADAYLKLYHQDGDGLPITDQDCDCGPFTKCLIDIDSFNEYKACYPLDTIPETIICTPTSVRTLANELSAVALSMPVMNRETGKLEMFKFKPPCGPIANIKNKQITNCKLNWAQSTAKQVTSVTYLTHPKDCTKGTSDGNLSDELFKPNVGAFGDACTNPAWLPNSEKEVKTRFIGKCNDYHTQISVQRLEYVLRKKKKAFYIEMEAKDLDFKETDFRTIEHEELQNADGLPSTEVFWVTQIDDLPNACHRVHFESSGFDAREKWGIGIFCESECPIIIDDCEEDCGGINWNRVW